MISLISRRGALAGAVAPLAAVPRNAFASPGSKSVDAFDEEGPPSITTYCYDREGILLAVVDPIASQTATFHYDCEAPHCVLQW
jgi:hypothetical protein